MDTMEQRVAKGVALLDEKKPNWRSIVNVDLLMMDSVDECILGQVFLGYSIALDVLNIRNEAHLYGFDITREQYLSECVDTQELFWELTALWTEEINKSQ